MKIAPRLAAIAISLTLANGAQAEKPIGGGTPMFETKNIVKTAVNSADHSKLMAAVQAAGIVETLQSPGPFTGFGPVNNAFAALPAGTVETVLKPENKDMLVKVLPAHVVAGDRSAAEIARRARASADGFTTSTRSPGAPGRPRSKAATGSFKTKAATSVG